MTTKKRYSGLRPFSNGLASVHRDGKAGYINTSGEEVIECRFRYAGSFNDLGYAVVGDEKGQKGVIDWSGNYIVQPQYEWIDMINNTSLISIKKYLDPAQLCNPQLINLKGDGRTLGEFDQIGGTDKNGNNGFVHVRHKIGKWSIIDETGELTMPFKYDYVSCYNYGKCENDIMGDYFSAVLCGKRLEQGGDDVAYNGGKYGLITPQGDVVLDFKYDELYYASDRCIIIGKGKAEYRKFGVITLNGETILPCQYDDIYVGNDVLSFRKQDYWGWADMNGKILVPPRFIGIGYNDSIGYYVELTLTQIINRCNDPTYSPVRFSEDCAAVIDPKSGKQGYVNKEGEMVIPYKFSPSFVLHPFKDGVAHCIKSQNRRGWIDRNGEFVIPPIYQTGHIHFGKEGYISVRLGDEHFYIDRTGTRCLF